ncbi:TorD/DmsD family molecular chaperone [Rubneribacter badeniensis]|uniref:TorD/DmsD family molecular chaperone n=1 Tax=Rubneribacter badeniensis TaxID=2070688 RepID=UPI003A953B2C
MSAEERVAPAARERAVALEELLAARRYAYALFHKLLGAAPDAGVLDALLGEAAASAVAAYAEDDETMRGFGRFLGELASRKDRAALLEAARDEYTRLFVGPGAVPAPACKSPYLAKDPALFQEGTLEVRAAYRARGLEPKRLQRVPDDHVALLCAFMALRAKAALSDLRGGYAAALAAELRDELTFLRAHLAGWVGEFARALRASKKAVLYPQLVEAFAAFVSIDAVFLTEAAYWAEGADALAALAAHEGERVAFAARIEDALAELEAVRPFGIEDYELALRGKDAPQDLK